MKCRIKKLSCFAFAVTLLLGLARCNSWNSHKRAQSQGSKDDKTREQVANATAKMKEESRVAAKNLDEAARHSGHELKVAAQGAQEGWNRKETDTVNVNSASKEHLETLPGLSARQCDKVIDGRPYSSTHDLVTQGIISQGEYDRIADRLTTR
jgi:DNA uptake protein ComE-like DNA-binding protein